MSRGYGTSAGNAGRWHYSSGDSYFPQYLFWYMILSDSGRHEYDSGTHFLENCTAATRGVDLEAQTAQCEAAVQEEHPVCQSEARAQAAGDATKLADGLKACDAATNEQIDACTFDARKVRYCLNNFGDPDDLDDRTKGYLASDAGKAWRAEADRVMLSGFEREITPLRTRLAGAAGKTPAIQVSIAREVSASLNGLKDRYEVPWSISDADRARWKALADNDAPEALPVIQRACSKDILEDIHPRVSAAIRALRAQSDAIGQAHLGESLALEFDRMIHGSGAH